MERKRVKNRGEGGGGGGESRDQRMRKPCMITEVPIADSSQIVGNYEF